MFKNDATFIATQKEQGILILIHVIIPFDLQVTEIWKMATK
jgi:hypothetical protein